MVKCCGSTEIEKIPPQSPAVLFATPPHPPLCVAVEREKKRKSEKEKDRGKQNKQASKQGRKQGRKRASKKASKQARKQARKKGRKKKRGLELLFSCVLPFVCYFLFALCCLLFFVCSLLFALFFFGPPFPPFALVCPLVCRLPLWFFLKIFSFVAADIAGFAKMFTNFHFCAVRIGQKSVRDKKQDSY